MEINRKASSDLIWILIQHQHKSKDQLIQDQTL